MYDVLILSLSSSNLIYNFICYILKLHGISLIFFPNTQFYLFFSPLFFSPPVHPILLLSFLFLFILFFQPIQLTYIFPCFLFFVLFCFFFCFFCFFLTPHWLLLPQTALLSFFLGWVWQCGCGVETWACRMVIVVWGFGAVAVGWVYGGYGIFWPLGGILWLCVLFLRGRLYGGGGIGCVCHGVWVVNQCCGCCCGGMGSIAAVDQGLGERQKIEIFFLFFIIYLFFLLECFREASLK